MRAILLGLVLLVPMAPGAVADDTCVPLGIPVTACATESSYAEGSCEAGEGFESRATSIILEAPGVASVVVTGSSWCYAYGGSEGGENGVSVVASTEQTSAGATWREFYYDDPKFGSQRYCFIASVEPIYASCPTALSPPDPGWGDMVP